MSLAYRHSPHRLFTRAQTPAALALSGALLLSLGSGLAGLSAGRAWALTPAAESPLPSDTVGVGIKEKLNAPVPLQLEFTDEDGKTVHLADYFDGRRPVILNLVYFECPMLCTLVLNGVTEGMKGLPWTLGREYQNVTVSFNPAETPALARAKKKSYLESYGRPGTAAGWHFLTGDEANIHALAQAVGFEYRYDQESHQFVHAAGTFLCTPAGKVSRVLYGIGYEQQTFRLGLLEASQGKVGSALEKIELYCFHYDANAGRYALAAARLMKAVGATSVLILGAVLAGFWSRERRRKQSPPSAGGEA